MDKLKEASLQLADLNLKLAEQKVVLAEKSTACEALLMEISTNTAVGRCGCLKDHLDQSLYTVCILPS